MDPLSTVSLCEQFPAERRYLNNVTPSTIEWYVTAFKALAMFGYPVCLLLTTQSARGE